MQSSPSFIVLLFHKNCPVNYWSEKKLVIKLFLTKHKCHKFSETFRSQQKYTNFYTESLKNLWQSLLLIDSLTSMITVLNSKNFETKDAHQKFRGTNKHFIRRSKNENMIYSKNAGNKNSWKPLWEITFRTNNIKIISTSS